MKQNTVGFHENKIKCSGFRNILGVISIFSHQKKKKKLYKNYTNNPTDSYEKWGSVSLSHRQFLRSYMILQPLNINGWTFHKKVYIICLNTVGLPVMADSNLVFSSCPNIVKIIRNKSRTQKKKIWAWNSSTHCQLITGMCKQWLWPSTQSWSKQYEVATSHRLR